MIWHLIGPLRIGTICFFAIAMAEPVFAQSPVSLILRLGIAAASHNEPARGTRTRRQDKLAQGFTFNSIPRNAGTQFVVVTDVQKLSRVASGYALPILLGADPVSRVPSLFAKIIETQCDQGMATLEYLGVDDHQESFRVTCGLFSGETGTETVVSPMPSAPGRYAGSTKTQNIEYLRVELSGFEITLDNEILISLNFRDTDARRGLAFAFLDPNSTGIADYWKFSPHSNAVVTDNSGNSFTVLDTDVQVFARNEDDYIILRSAEKQTITLRFYTRGAKLGSSFNLNVGVWIVTLPTSGNKPHRLAHTIHLRDIRPM